MTEKDPDPKLPADKDAVSEEVVLASTPQTPIHLAIDDKELIDENDPDSAQQAAAQAAQTGSGRFEPLLAALRQPEQRLAAAYRHSTIHRLLRDRFEWYRDLEDNKVLGATLEDTYDAKYGSRLHQFVKSNVLCTLLGLTAIALAAQNGLNYAFDDRSAKREQVATKASKGKARKNAKAAAAAPQQALTEVLQHCIVTATARVNLDGASKDVAQAAMFEINRFRARYEESNVQRLYSDALHKGIAVEQALRSLMAVARDFTAQLETRLDTLEREQGRLRGELKAMRVDSTAGAVATINQRIQVRDELTRVDDTIASGPSRKASGSLTSVLDALERALTVPPGTAPIPSEQNGLVDAERMSAEQFAHELENTVSQQVLEPIATYGDASPALQRYRLQLITDTVERLAVFHAFYSVRPRELFHQLDREQARVNQRLATLTGDARQPQGAALDVSGCLEPVDGVRAAHHELPAASGLPST